MRVGDFALRSDDLHNSAIARIGDFPLWIRTDRCTALRNSIDPFVAAALLPAMILGEDIEIDPRFPVSTVLAENLMQLQQIFNSWNSLFRRVEIRCTQEPAEPTSDRTGSFFSGGVDSQHSFLQQRTRISDMVFINGFDFWRDGELQIEAVQRVRSFANHFGTSLVTVGTNYHAFERHHRMCRTLSFGSALASVGLALGFKQMYIPSGSSYAELSPHGSHPLTDHLWSNGTTQFTHDGAGWTRGRKIEFLAKEQRFLDELSVCWVNSRENCGKCPKCLRTRITLRMLGLSSIRLPALVSPKEIRDLTLTGPKDVTFLSENLQLARERNDGEYASELSRIIRRHRILFAIAKLDEAVLSGFLTRISRSLKHPPHLIGFWSYRLPVGMANENLRDGHEK